MVQRLRAILAAVATLFGVHAASAAPYYVTTGHTHANTQIDIDHSSTWSLTLGAGAALDLGGGNLTLKRGQHTALPVTLSLYLGMDASGLLLESVSVAAGAVTQAYGPVHFGFAAPVALSGGGAGANYFLALTSATADAGSRQYFIKSEQATTLAFAGTGVPGASGTGAGQATVPEPASAGLLGAALVGLGLAWRRRRAAR